MAQFESYEVPNGTVFWGPHRFLVDTATNYTVRVQANVLNTTTPCSGNCLRLGQLETTSFTVPFGAAGGIP